MHCAKLDLIPSQQFRGASLPVTFHSTLFIAETGASPRTVDTRETTFSSISKEDSRAIVVFYSSVLLLACCRVQRGEWGDDAGEETSGRTTSLAPNQKQCADLCLEHTPSFQHLFRLALNTETTLQSHCSPVTPEILACSLFSPVCQGVGAELGLWSGAVAV